MPAQQGKYRIDAAGDFGPLLKEFKKGYKALEAMEGRLDRVTKSQKRQGAHEKSMKSQVALLTRMAAGWLSVGAAVRGVNEAYRQHNQLQDKAASTIVQQQDYRKMLLDVATAGDGRTMAQDLKRLEARVKHVRRQTGMNDYQATKTVFDLRSFGWDDQLSDVMELSKITQIDEILPDLKTLYENFGGSIQENLNMMYAAAKPSKLSLKKITMPVAKQAQLYREADFKIEDAMAAAAVSGQQFHSPEEAATAFRRVAQQAAQDKDAGLVPRDMGMLQYLTWIRNLPKHMQQERFAEIRTKVGFSALLHAEEKVGNLREVIRTARDLTGTDQSEISLRMAARSPEMRRAYETRVQTQRREVAERQNAREGAAYQQAMDAAMETQYSRGAGIGMKWAAQKRMDIFRFLNYDPEIVQQVGELPFLPSLRDVTVESPYIQQYMSTFSDFKKGTEELRKATEEFRKANEPKNRRNP